MCSATMIVGRFVVAVGMVGMIEASAIVRPSIPWTEPRESVTAPSCGIGTHGAGADGVMVGGHGGADPRRESEAVVSAALPVRARVPFRR